MIPAAPAPATSAEHNRARRIVRVDGFGTALRASFRRVGAELEADALQGRCRLVRSRSVRVLQKRSH